MIIAVRRDQRPVIQPRSLRPVGAAQPFPGASRDQPCELIGAPDACLRLDHGVARDREDVRDLLGLQPFPLVRVAICRYLPIA